MIIFYDTETYCETPINHGTHRYAEGVEVMIETWAIDDGPVQLADRTAGEEGPWSVFEPEDFDAIVIHQSGFDRTVVRHALDVVLPVERIHDTMVQAQSHGLPGGLDKLCDIFKLGDLAKLKTGKQLIQLFCKPRPAGNKIQRATRHTHPIEWERFKDYARADIPSMRHLYKHMPRVNYPSLREHALWCLDQRMNDRGFAVDTELAEAAIATVAKAKRVMDARTQEITDDGLRSTTQRDQLLRHVLAEYGVDLPDMQGSTLERRLQDSDLPAGARELLAMRLQTSTTSNAKYQSLLRSVSSDGRLRGTMLFSGAARTKRWAGRTFQPQNLPRPDMPQDEIEDGILMMKAGAAHLLHDEPIKLASNAIRGCIVAPEGRKLVVSDLAQVEARVLPWLAGEQWKLEAFARYDRGEGFDNYVQAYARGFGVPPEEVDKGGRQIGKVSELSCLGPHTRVLTSNGVKPITEVKLNDYLWDGVQWVAHLGLVSRGVKPVIRLNGLVVTPDHLILGAHGWHEAQTVASSPNILQSSLAIALANSPWSDLSEEQWAESEALLFNVLVEPNPIVSGRTTCEKVPALAAIRAPRRQPEPTSKNTTAMPLSAPMTNIAVGYLTDSQPANSAATIPVTEGMLTTALEELNSGLHGAPTSEPFLSMSYRLTGGMIPLSNWTGSTPTEGTNPVTYGSSRAQPTPETSVAFVCSSNASSSLSDVYDIAHAGPNNRFTVLTDDGALLVHNCGYGGAVGAWKAMGLLYGFELPDSQVKEIVTAWRAAHPAICDWSTGFWAQLDQAARLAIRTPGKTFTAGEHIRFERWREWLRMELPSGGFLNYAAPAIIDDPRRPGSDTVSYLGINNYSRKWERITTYGGKLSADATQATAREIMADALPEIEAQGFDIIMLIHDEVVTEAPVDSDVLSVDLLSKLLSKNRSWNVGLPLAASGYEAPRYRKDA